jgi:hypothetical protein
MGVKFGNDPSTFEDLWFYQNTVHIKYDDGAHVYYLVDGDRLIPQDSVTTVLKVLDKSDALVPWGCSCMESKLLSLVPQNLDAVGRLIVPAMALEELRCIVAQSKTAHKEKLEDAADIGKAAHYWIQRYIQRKLGIVSDIAATPTDERVKSCIRASLGWMKAHNVRWLNTERKVYSLEWKYTGTLDGKCLVDSCDNPQCCKVPFKDHLSIIDWKSSNYVSPTYFWQVALYWNANEEENHENVLDGWVIRLGKTDDTFDPWYIPTRHMKAYLHSGLLCLRLYRAAKWTKERMREILDHRKACEKELRQIERDAAHRVKCEGARKYKGVRYPKCNGGQPCEFCLNLYYQNHPNEERLDK